MGKKTQGVIFLLLSVGSFGNLLGKLNQPSPAPTLDIFSISLPIVFSLIGLVLVILGVREKSNKLYE